jgi:hypothetical protein
MLMELIIKETKVKFNIAFLCITDVKNQCEYQFAVNIYVYYRLNLHAP